MLKQLYKLFYKVDEIDVIHTLDTRNTYQKVHDKFLADKKSKEEYEVSKLKLERIEQCILYSSQKENKDDIFWEGIISPVIVEQLRDQGFEVTVDENKMITHIRWGT